ncbi:MAG: glycosyl transferase, group 2 family protein [Clostridiales bacterium]|jgi:glycosyltransferase involved in cell wall biosynthesis|nr:glycosyl transferase, group 2 family protein [Clostridiales bacterium]
MDTTPLVSILIPAYNRPDYLEQALKSAIEQSYENIEIIICDDSTNNDVFNMVNSYIPLHSNILYFKNDKPLGEKGLLNAQKCLDLSSGEYVNFLMDDDLFHKDKIMKMLPYLLNNKTLSLVTSHREIINENDDFLPPIPSSVRLFNQTTVIEGKAFIGFLLKNLLNVIGEPTTVLFRKKDIENRFGFYNGKQYRCLTDFAMWIQLLSRGDGVYIPETLSYFRIHKGQNSKDPELMSLGSQESFTLIKDTFENGILGSRKAYDDCLFNWVYGNLSRIIKINKAFQENESLEPNFLSATELYKCFDYTLKELLGLN